MTRAALAAAAVLLVVAIPVGRWEGRRSVDARNAGIERILREKGRGLDNASLTGVRTAEPLDCLLYSSAAVIYRWEICMRSDGTVIEAIDRRREPATIYSFREEPAAARVAIPPKPVFTIMQRFGLFRTQRFTGALPSLPEELYPFPTLRPMLRVAIEVGPQLGRFVSGWRLRPGRACLEEVSGRYELCFDRRGVLVSVRDRRLSLEEAARPADSPLRAKVARLRAVLVKIGALPRSTPVAATLPLDITRSSAH